MTVHGIQFEATEGGLVLKNAILLYREHTPSDRYYWREEGGKGQTFASIHAVEHHDGQPVIAAGVPLSRAHLRQWTEALGRSAAPEILPENVLVAHPDMLAWWVPEKVRPSYFHLKLPPKDLKALTKRIILPLPYPAHLFVATRRGLGVYALPASERPSADTVVLHSPVLNVFLNGQLCWGNIPQPKALGIAAMADYERAVFDSWSTHPNPGQDLTVTGKGGLLRLWDDLAARKAKRFPAKRLKPFYPERRPPNGPAPITFGKLIAGGTR
ncbi:PRTRC system protein B [Sphingopyxis sp. J-6]|uniref:PRTRC system protein B n=1 Tax=Sphingopyxis sp. J-6 TaxID=3122054 RepID=UPI0039844405